MEYFRLNNDLEIPAAGFGVFQVPDPAVCTQAVIDAVAAGYRLIDTAQSYGNEEAVGKGIAECGIDRQELFITTKVWISSYGYEKCLASVNASLEKMGLEYLDLVLLHQPFGDYYGAWRALEELYQAGKIRAIGVSNFYPDRIVDFCLNVEVRPAVNQVECNIFNQQDQILEWDRKYEVQTEAWAPFAEGKHNMFQNPVLSTIGEKYGKSVAQVILRWLYQRGIVSLCKSVKKARMEQNIDIFDFVLSEEDMRQIAALNRNETSFFWHNDPAAVEMIEGLKR